MNISGFACGVLICLLGSMLVHAATTAVAEPWNAERWMVRTNNRWKVGYPIRFPRTRNECLESLNDRRR